MRPDPSWSLMTQPRRPRHLSGDSCVKVTWQHPHPHHYPAPQKNPFRCLSNIDIEFNEVQRELEAIEMHLVFFRGAGAGGGDYFFQGVKWRGPKDIVVCCIIQNPLTKPHAVSKKKKQNLKKIIRSTFSSKNLFLRSPQFPQPHHSPAKENCSHSLLTGLLTDCWMSFCRRRCRSRRFLPAPAPTFVKAPSAFGSQMSSFRTYPRFEFVF